MPNQRAKDKVHIGGYYHEKLKDELTRAAKAKGMSRSRFIEELLKAGVEDYKRRRGTSSSGGV